MDEVRAVEKNIDAKALIILRESQIGIKFICAVDDVRDSSSWDSTAIDPTI